jgi:hypothetical protein
MTSWGIVVLSGARAAGAYRRPGRRLGLAGRTGHHGAELSGRLKDLAIPQVFGDLPLAIGLDDVTEGKLKHRDLPDDRCLSVGHCIASCFSICQY